MATFKDFFSSTRGKKSATQSEGSAHSLRGLETSPVKMKLEERMAFRRDLLFDAIRSTLGSRHIAPGSYRFRVMRTDKRGHCFLVMLDMAPTFIASPKGHHTQLTEIASALTRNALAKYGLVLGGVYWRADETLHTAVADAARPTRQNTSAEVTTEPATTLSHVENHEHLTAEELAEFEAAWQKSSHVQVGNRVYSSDQAPLDKEPPGK